MSGIKLPNHNMIATASKYAGNDNNKPLSRFNDKDSGKPKDNNPLFIREIASDDDAAKAAQHVVPAIVIEAFTITWFFPIMANTTNFYFFDIITHKSIKQNTT